MMEIDARNIEIMDERMAELLRNVSGEKKWLVASQMHNTLCGLLREFIQAQNPDWDDSQIKREMSRRLGHGPV